MIRLLRWGPISKKQITDETSRKNHIDDGDRRLCWVSDPTSGADARRTANSLGRRRIALRAQPSQDPRNGEILRISRIRSPDRHTKNEHLAVPVYFLVLRNRRNYSAATERSAPAGAFE